MRNLMRLAAALAVALGLVWPAFADTSEPVTLALKFAPGDTLDYDVSLSGAGSFTAPDRTRSTLTLQGDFTVNERVAQVNGDGSASLELLLPRADISVGVMGKTARFAWLDGKLHWYTDGVEQTPPQVDTLKMKLPVLQTPMLVTMTPEGRVTSATLSDQSMLDLLRKAVPGLDQQLMTPNATTTLPDHPVAVGETWTDTKELPLAPGMTATCRIRHTLDSVMGGGDQQLAKITGFTEIKLRAASFSPPGQSAVSVAIPDLKETISSTEFFSVTAGRLVRANYDIGFGTKITATAQAKSVSGGLDARVLVDVVVR